MGAFQVTFAQDERGTWPFTRSIVVHISFFFFFRLFLGLLKQLPGYLFISKLSQNWVTSSEISLGF